MKPKEALVIAREWHNPTVHVWVSDETLGVSIPIDDYLIAMAMELGDPTLLEKIKAAHLRVAASAKKYVARVI
jgi:hypothetical protein